MFPIQKDFCLKYRHYRFGIHDLAGHNLFQQFLKGHLDHFHKFILIWMTVTLLQATGQIDVQLLGTEARRGVGFSKIHHLIRLKTSLFTQFPAGGGLDSRVGWKGLARKFVTMLIVVVANLADALLGQNCIRDAAVVGFCANECISILENAGHMGIRIPGALRRALEHLNKEEEEHDGT